MQLRGVSSIAQGRPSHPSYRGAYSTAEHVALASNLNDYGAVYVGLMCKTPGLSQIFASYLQNVYRFAFGPLLVSKTAR